MSGHEEKRYWKGLKERDRDPIVMDRAKDEFPDGILNEEKGLRFSRRSFLKAVGFAFGGAVLSGCTGGSVEKAIPYLVQPEDIVPGRASWYATLCQGCAAGCGVLARNREGRPVKLEGNPEHPLSRGGLCAVGQASLLGLYDSKRLETPVKEGKSATWAEVDGAIRGKLEAVKKAGGSVRFLTGSLSSPTLRSEIDAFLAQFQDGKRVAWDALSQSALLDAHAELLGRRICPAIHLDRATVILGVDADFLGTWIAPAVFSKQYRAGRQLDGGSYSHHIQAESHLSLTGSNADTRVVCGPNDLSLLLAHVATRVSKKAGNSAPWKKLPACSVEESVIDTIADRLWRAPRGESIVLCGLNDVVAQRITAYLNVLLGNYGTTAEKRPLDIERPSRQVEGDDGALAALRDELEAGSVDACFVLNTNPVYGAPGGSAWGKALEKAGLVVSFGERIDETAAHADFVCPAPHPYATWNDAEPVAGLITVGQPIFDDPRELRPVVESLATWAGEKKGNALAIFRNRWEKELHPRALEKVPFQVFWDRALHDGFVRVQPEPVGAEMPEKGEIPSAPSASSQPGEGELLLVCHPKVGMLDGRHAHNAWLQELPDPVTKLAWENVAALAPATAKAFRLEEGDVVRIQAGETTIELPCLLQPGLDPTTIAVALGYGRKGTERFTDIGPEWLEGRPTVEPGEFVGRNVAPLLEEGTGGVRYSGRTVKVKKTGRTVALAATQLHHSLHVPEHLAPANQKVRPMVQETTLEAYRKDPHAGSHHGHGDGYDMWTKDFESDGPRWGMAIDLSACTGCSACVLSCQIENNVPVVGKDEVRRSREMHWMRIDRYYAGEGEEVDVVHQPMLCQQCDNAPCESVCPVLATVHSEEGLNQQVYNRCVGTRYCANNCPYKVRRFNWFDYPHADPFQNLVLNPDVTVRSQGVMEKCSFCVQRIMAAKAEAKADGRALADGDIETACQQSCPTEAIRFGDLNDPESDVAKALKSPRNYHVLSELNVEPSIGYLRVVRNRPESEGGGSHHG